ncbi:Uncharacterised protein [Mycobacteroides abscessus]|nr:Uncharacterised protein [Mycobacteroides abscessus]
MRHPGDPDPVDPESRQRRRLRRRPHGVGGRRPTAHRDGIAPHSRTRGGGLRPCGLSRGLRIDIQSGGTTPLRCACPGDRCARLHAAARQGRHEPRRGRTRGVPGTGRGARRRHHPAGRYLRHHRRSGERHRRRRHRARRGTHRFRRSGHAGEAGPGATGRVRRAPNPHRGVRGPRRILHRGAARRARRHLRSGHLGGDRLGNTDRGYGLQARRNRWHSRG